jgi:hypothetical protein
MASTIAEQVLKYAFVHEPRPAPRSERSPCALTVRTLKPGTFDQFHEAFMRDIGDGAPPAVVEDVALAPNTTA